MAHRSRKALPQQAEILRAQIAEWRRTKAQRTSPMPAALWTSAAALGRSHGAYRVAKALGLARGALHRRAKVKITIRKTGGAAGAPSFVQLWPGSPAHADSQGESVEMTNAAGTRVIVHVAASNRLDAVALAAAFMSRSA